MATKPKPPAWTASDIVRLIRTKYGDGQRYMVFEQVANGTGVGYGYSWIDAAVVELWPSDGLNSVAFEVKVSRSDFTKEIETGKNAWVLDDFNQFYYVAPRSVIKSEDEVPERCGWYEPTRSGLRLKKLAQTIDHGDTVDTAFFASLIRSVGKELDKDRDAILEQAKKEDKEILRWKQDSEILDQWLRSHKQYREWKDKPKEVVKKLEATRIHSKDEEEFKHITRRLEEFKEAMYDMLEQFLRLSQAAMLETDDVGKFIVDRYGVQGVDVAINRYEREERKRVREFIETKGSGNGD